MTGTFAIHDMLLPAEARTYVMGGRHEVAIPYRREGASCQNCGGGGVVFVWSDEPRRGGAGTSPRSTRFDAEGNRYDAWLVSAPCPVCALGESSRYRRLLQSRSGVPPAHWGVTLARMDAIPGQEEMRQLVAAALSGADDAVMAGLFGAYGVGKTWHLYALVNGCTALGLPARYATQSQYLNRLRSTFDAGGERTASVLAEYVDARVLCLDEIGTNVELTGWAAEQVRELLTRRSDGGTGVTVVAGNVAPSKLGAEWGWLSSRLSGRVITVEGRDLRG